MPECRVWNLEKRLVIVCLHVIEWAHADGQMPAGSWESAKNIPAGKRIGVLPGDRRADLLEFSAGVIRYDSRGCGVPASRASGVVSLLAMFDQNTQIRL